MFEGPLYISRTCTFIILSNNYCNPINASNGDN